MSASRVAGFMRAALVIGAFASILTGTAQAAIGVMSTPVPGTTLTGASVTFTWAAGTNVQQYYLYVGSVAGGNDLYGQNQSTNLTATVNNLPTDGRTLYVRLWSLVTVASDIAVGWQFNDYQYLAFNSAGTCGTPSPATMTTPAPGSTLPGATTSFQWTGGACVTQYTLAIGTSVGASNIYGPTAGTTLTQTVATLPTDGSAVFVRLTSTIGGNPQSNDYTYTAFNASSGCATPSAATITGPTPGSTLAGASQAFTWSAGCSVVQYYLYVGSAAAANDLFGQDQGTNLTTTVNNLPVDGRTLYVRIWSLYGGIWHFNDYTFKAAGGAGGCGTASPANMVTPANGSTLTGAAQAFTWDAGACVTQYTLSVGNQVGGSEIYGPTAAATLTQTVNSLPTDGRPLFVRLSSLINGVNQSRDYTYLAFTAASGCSTPAGATMTTPAPSSTLAGASVTFTWSTGCSVTEYYLYVGTSLASNDLYGQDQGTKLTAVVDNLPTNGSTLYVRLWSLYLGVWHFNDYTYTASGAVSGCGSPSAATMISPTPGSTLPGSSATFTWSPGACVTQYTISVGTSSGGTQISGPTSGTTTSAVVNGLPTLGQTVYVRLTSTIAGINSSNDYTYTAYSTATGCGTSTLATMASPTPGSTLPGASVPFSWSAGCNVTQYYLYVGTSAGTNNLYGASQGTALTGTVPNLPTTGQTLYVRLWSFLSTAATDLSTGWHFADYTYTAAGNNTGCGTPAAAAMTSPTPGTTFTGASAVFIWNTGTCVTSYTLAVGSSVGASDIFLVTQGVSVTATVNNLPTNGQTVFVRLTSLINGVNQNADYTYTASAGATGCTGASAATMLTPASGSTLPGATATFTWTAGCNVSQYYLYVGTAVGTNDLYGLSQGTSLTGTVGGLPTTGQILYVRLWSFLSTAATDLAVGWHFNDYTFRASN